MNSLDLDSTMSPIALDWVQIATLLGAIQGAFLGLLLATQRRNQTANRIMAALMFAFSIGLSSNVYYAAGLVERFPHLFAISYPLPFLYGPLIYLYAVSAADRTRGLRWWDALHFLPVAALLVAMMPVFVMSGQEKIEFYHALLRGIRTPLVNVSDPLKYVSGMTYTTLTLVFLWRHRAKVKESYASTERVNLQWLFRLGLSSAAIWLLATTLEIMELLNRPILARADDAVGLAVAILVYAIGYSALRQPEIFHFAGWKVRTSEWPIPRGATTPVTEVVVPEPVSVAAAVVPDTSPPAAARYERSGLSDTEAAALERGLIATMEKELLYQNSDLTLADLSERLDTTPHKLSEVLNSQLDQTFYDFVNAYRVREVQRRIADGGLRNATILSLAMDAGFASKSTFNAVFRQHAGQTPSAYRRSIESTTKEKAVV